MPTTVRKIYEIAQGDLSPPMLIDLTDEDVVANVANAINPLTMRWLKPDGTVVEGVTITNVNLVLGQVLHAWAAGETDIPGVHRAQVIVPKADGNETFPSDGSYIRWVVHPKL